MRSFGAILLIALAGSCATTPEPEPILAVYHKLEQNKELIRRFFEEVYNKGNYAFADSVIASDYKSHNRLGFEVLGPEGIKKAAKAQRDAFPDQRSAILDLVAEGDKVVVRGRDTGTFTHAFMGMEPSGKRIDITWIDIFRIENGRLMEAWLEIDAGEFRRQLKDGA